VFAAGNAVAAAGGGGSTAAATLKAKSPDGRNKGTRGQKAGRQSTEPAHTTMPPPEVPKVDLAPELAAKLAAAKEAVTALELATDSDEAYDAAVKPVAALTVDVPYLQRAEVTSNMKLLLQALKEEEVPPMEDLVGVVCGQLEAIAQAKQRAAGPAAVSTELRSEGTNEAAGASDSSGGRAGKQREAPQGTPNSKKRPRRTGDEETQELKDFKAIKEKLARRSGVSIMLLGSGKFKLVLTESKKAALKCEARGWGCVVERHGLVEAVTTFVGRLLAVLEKIPMGHSSECEAVEVINLLVGALEGVADLEVVRDMLLDKQKEEGGDGKTLEARAKERAAAVKAAKAAENAEKKAKAAAERAAAASAAAALAIAKAAAVPGVVAAQTGGGAGVGGVAEQSSTE